MRKLPLLLIAAMLLFSACAEEEFTLSGLSIAMERKASSDASGLTDENAVLRISAEVSQPGSIYTYRLVSPDGDLVWEGAMNAVEEGSDILVSDPAEITAGALFPEGEYSLIIYSDSGTEVSDTVSFSYEHSLRHFQDGELIGNVLPWGQAGSLSANTFFRSSSALHLSISSPAFIAALHAITAKSAASRSLLSSRED